MLRNLCLSMLMSGLIVGPSAQAEELAKADPMPVVAQGTPSSPPDRLGQDLYMLCAFYPKPGTCENIYRRAMQNQSIIAQAVKAEYTGYARYLGGSASLSYTDRQYLKDHGIWIPGDLSLANQAGLHNVINDASLGADAKQAAINNFISRAVEAELYCGFNSCEVQDGQSASSASPLTR